MTLGQFQEIYKIQKSDMDELDKVTEMVAVVSGRTPREVDEMPIPEFNNLASQVTQTLSTPLTQAKPTKFIKGIGITYEPGKLTRGQYVTVMHFMKGDHVENCHLILASISYDPKTKKHEAEKHPEIAARLQEAELSEVYPSCVFFCQLFERSIRSLESFFIKQLRTKGMNKSQSLLTVKALLKDLDGSIMLRESLNLKA